MTGKLGKHSRCSNTERPQHPNPKFVSPTNRIHTTTPCFSGRRRNKNESSFPNPSFWSPLCQPSDWRYYRSHNAQHCKPDLIESFTESSHNLSQPRNATPRNKCFLQNCNSKTEQKRKPLASGFNSAQLSWLPSAEGPEPRVYLGQYFPESPIPLKSLKSYYEAPYFLRYIA